MCFWFPFIAVQLGMRVNKLWKSKEWSASSMSSHFAWSPFCIICRARIGADVATPLWWTLGSAFLEGIDSGIELLLLSFIKNLMIVSGSLLKFHCIVGAYEIIVKFCLDNINRKSRFRTLNSGTWTDFFNPVQAFKLTLAEISYTVSHGTWWIYFWVAMHRLAL